MAMQASELQELLNTIHGLIESTRQGTLIWSEANKTTYYWTNPAGGRLVLQRTQEPPRLVMGRVLNFPQYVFQAVDTATGKPVFSVDSDESDQIRHVVDALYESIQARISQQGISFLKSILPR
jgi:hypothetical protein